MWLCYLKWLLSEWVWSWPDHGLDSGFVKDSGCGLTDQPGSGVVTGNHADAEAEEAVTVVKVNRPTWSNKYIDAVKRFVGTFKFQFCKKLDKTRFDYLTTRFVCHFAFVVVLNNFTTLTKMILHFCKNKCKYTLGLWLGYLDNRNITWPQNLKLFSWFWNCIIVFQLYFFDKPRLGNWFQSTLIWREK